MIDWIGPCRFSAVLSVCEEYVALSSGTHGIFEVAAQVMARSRWGCLHVK